MEMIVISPSKLKIMLTPPDMQRYDLPSEALDCTDESTRRTFRRIIEDARAETGFETAGQQLFIQLYTSRDGGCELFVTKLGRAADTAGAADKPDEMPEQALLRKVFAVEVTSPSAGGGSALPLKRPPAVPEPSAAGTRPAALLFSSSDDLLAACARLLTMGYRQESRAYILDGGQWCLLLRVPDTSFFRLPAPFGFLSEYGTEADASVLSPYVCEHGRPVCTSHAVETLGMLS
ncbi:MAG: adaptor protein MecA [Clostridia bacterium]|nr:adaptor protein MecA [Clostridia bacterium]